MSPGVWLYNRPQSLVTFLTQQALTEGNPWMKEYRRVCVCVCVGGDVESPQRESCALCVFSLEHAYLKLGNLAPQVR